MGGIAAHAQGKAHQFTPEEARAADRKGGLARKKVSDGVPSWEGRYRVSDTGWS
ncbi:hypothetical protein [Bradyrhizobium sp. NP1]|uniref:hypothetical protein n=1 Tax=Bradyrhizobium sp. NP1 TaxID=3049772 RepID=UPI0025A62640|nr:hypothetical protein [Bradyrhizobium sp. NP1]WJR79247.1 hypothetical protein QOU61_05510 [Bradyrhizobium sp. NP1]